MPSAADICSASLIKLGVLAISETPSAAVAKHAFETLNRMISGWRLDPLMSPLLVRTTGALSANVQTYTVGVGGTIAISPYPTLGIFRAGVLPATATTTEMPVRVLDDDQWSRIKLKSLTSDYVQMVYFDHGYSSSQRATLSVYPIPASSGQTIVLYTKEPTAQFSTQPANYVLRDGLERALLYNLCLELAPDFGRVPDGMIIANAKEALIEIGRTNLRASTLKTDDAMNGPDGGSGGTWNWISGGF